MYKVLAVAIAALVLATVLVPVPVINAAVQEEPTVVERGDSIIVKTLHYEVKLSKTGGHVSSIKLVDAGVSAYSYINGDGLVRDFVAVEGRWVAADAVYDVVNVSMTDGVVKVALKSVVGLDGYGMLEIVKEYVFYRDSYFFDAYVMLRNLNNVSLGLSAKFLNSSIETSYVVRVFAAVGVLGGERPLYLDKEGRVLVESPALRYVLWKVEPRRAVVKYFGVYDPIDRAVFVVVPRNATNAVFTNSSTLGAGVIVGFNPLSLHGDSPVVYVFRVVCTPLDIELVRSVGLVELAESLETALFAVSDSAIYRVGDSASLTVIVSRRESPANVSVTLDVFRGLKRIKFAELYSGTVEDSLKLSYTVQLRDADEYIFRVSVKVGDTIVKQVDVWAAAIEPTYAPTYLALVFNIESPPAMLPDGTFYLIEPFSKVWDSVFIPYFEGGAYAVYAQMLQKHSSLRVTCHISPALLEAWDRGVENGVHIAWGGKEIVVSRDDPRVLMLRNTLDAYRELASEGRLELLASFYAPVSPGTVLKVFGSVGLNDLAYELLLFNLVYGKNITEVVLESRVYGAWVPHPLWDERLIKLLLSSGYRYVVLSGVNASTGIFAIVDPSTGESIPAFVVDTNITRVLGSLPEFADEMDAESMARHVLKLLYADSLKHSDTVLVVAIDVDELLLHGRNPPLNAYFLDRLLSYIDKARFAIKTVTLSEALKMFSPESALTLPRCGEQRRNLSSMDEVVRCAVLVEVLREIVPVQERYKALVTPETPLAKAYKALSIALDLRLMMRQEMQRIADAWSTYAKQVTYRALDKVDVTVLVLKSYSGEGPVLEVTVRVINNLPFTIRLPVTINGTAVKGEMYEITVPASSRETQHFTVPLVSDEGTVAVYCAVRGYVFCERVYEVREVGEVSALTPLHIAAIVAIISAAAAAAVAYAIVRVFGRK